MPDSYDVLVTVIRKDRTKDGGGGFLLADRVVQEGIRARFHRYSGTSEYRQEVENAGRAAQGPGTTTRYRRFLRFEKPDPPIAVNDRLLVYSATNNEPVIPIVRDDAGNVASGAFLTLDFRSYQFGSQADIELVA